MEAEKIREEMDKSRRERVMRPVEGIKLIRHNAARVNEPDDPSFPWKLDLNFSPPEFMVMAWVGLFGGSEEITIRGMTKEALEEFVEQNKFREHPRLRWMEFTDPDGKVERWRPERRG